jgi:hypothetical protein
VCAAFILYAANENVFLNFRLYNLLSIALACVVLIQFSRLYAMKLTAARAYTLLALIFLSGINIKARPKAFLFLALLFVVLTIHRRDFSAHGFRRLVHRETAAPIASFTLALFLFMLSFSGTGALWLVFILTIALLVVQAYDLLLSNPVHRSASGGGDS